MRHEGVLHLWWKGVAPQVGVAVGIVADSTHSSLRGIGGADKGRQLGHDLSQVGGSATQACCQGSKGVEVPAQGVIDADSVVLGAVESQLQSNEEV